MGGYKMGEGKDACCAFLPGYKFGFGKHIELEDSDGILALRSILNRRGGAGWRLMTNHF